jgi:hypothetical protein
MYDSQLLSMPEQDEDANISTQYNQNSVGNLNRSLLYWNFNDGAGQYPDNRGQDKH